MYFEEHLQTAASEFILLSLNYRQREARLVKITNFILFNIYFINVGLALMFYFCFKLKLQELPYSLDLLNVFLKSLIQA